MSVHIAKKCKHSIITVWIDDEVCSESKSCSNLECPNKREENRDGRSTKDGK